MSIAESGRRWAAFLLCFLLAGCLPVTIGIEADEDPPAEEPPVEEPPAEEPPAEEPPAEEEPPAAGIAIFADVDSLSVPEGESRAVQVRLSAAPSGPVVLRAELTAGAAFFSIDDAELDFGSGDWNTAQAIQVRALADGNTAHDAGTLRLTLVGGDDEVLIALTQVDAESGAAPVEASQLGDWAEGTYDKSDGATRDFFNAAVGYTWRNKMGDWHDAAGVAQGSTPFTTATVSGTKHEWDATTLVKGWVDGTWPNKGFFLRGGSGTLLSRETSDASQRPTLIVNTTSGVKTLTAVADTYLDGSTFRGFGDQGQLRLGYPVLVRFDLTGIAKGTVSSATLRLTSTGGGTGAGLYRSSQGNEVPDVTPVLGLAKNYAGDANIKNHADVLLFSDFESDDWGADWSGGQTAGTLKVVESDGFGFEKLSGRALRVSILAGNNTGMNLLYRFQGKLGYEPTEMYFRYYLRVSSQWDPSDGGKLPGFAGTYDVAGWGGAKSDGTNGWSERGAFRKCPPSGNPLAGMMPIANYSYHADMKDFYGDINDWTRGHRGVLARNRWYCIEQYCKLNTVGKSDGVLRAWVDGLLAHERTAMQYRTVDSLKIEVLWMNVYHGGLAPMPQDGHLYMDNIVIAKSYIGPMAK